MELKHSIKPVVPIPNNDVDLERHPEEDAEESGLDVGKDMRTYPNFIRFVHEDDKRLDGEQKRYLKDTMRKLPPFLLRAYSEELPRRTHCHNSEDYFIPAMTQRLQTECNSSMLDIPVEAASVMAGHHLLWHDRNHDELISWTNSLVFIIVHAQGRYYAGQGYCKIALIDRRKATRAETPEHPVGPPAEFYRALDLFNVFRVRDSKCWGRKSRTKLQSRMYTHEYLSHGIVEYNDNKLRHVSLRELIENGLFELYPEFRIDKVIDSGLFDLQSQPKLDELIEKGLKNCSIDNDSFPKAFPNDLYQRCVALRQNNFRKGAGPCGSQQDIETAWKLAKLFVREEQGTISADFGTKPPLPLLLLFLSLRERPTVWKDLQCLIKNDYSGDDLEELLYPDLHKVADNLDDVQQYIKLVQQACQALNAFTDAIPGLHLIKRNGTYRGHTYRARENKKPYFSLLPIGSRDKIIKTIERIEMWRKGRSVKRLEKAKVIAEERASSLERKREELHHTDNAEAFEQTWKHSKLNNRLQALAGIAFEEDEEGAEDDGDEADNDNEEDEEEG